MIKWKKHKNNLLVSFISSSNKTNLKIVKFIEEWNSKYPFDSYWRKKYNIPFRSPQHLSANAIDMMIDISEDKWLKDRKDDVKSLFEEKPTLCELAGIKDTFVYHLSGKELDKAFEELDISKF